MRPRLRAAPAAAAASSAPLQASQRPCVQQQQHRGGSNCTLRRLLSVTPLVSTPLCSTNTIGAVARIRNALAYATHRFFQACCVWDGAANGDCLQVC